MCNTAWEPSCSLLGTREGRGAKVGPDLEGSGSKRAQSLLCLMSHVYSNHPEALSILHSGSDMHSKEAEYS